MIVVTGAKGFIGSNLIKALTDRGINVYPIDLDNLYDYKELNGISRIYHLGALSSTDETDLDEIHRLNIKYSIDLFEYAIEHRIPVTYASSAAVYGNSVSYIKSLNPLNFYAHSKSIVDLWVGQNIDRFKQVIGLRFFNVWGPGEEHKRQPSPIRSFTDQAINNGIIKVFNPPYDGIRDFIHVRDVVACMFNTKVPSGIYDIGTNRTWQFSEIAKMIAKKFDVKIQFVECPAHLKKGYQYITVADKNVITDPLREGFFMVDNLFNQPV